MDVKKCTKCGIEKSTSEFHKDQTKVDGLRPRCKQCRRGDSKIYYEQNNEEIIRKVSEWRDQNRARFRKTNAQRKRVRRLNDPVFVLKERLSNSIRRTLTSNSIPKKKSSFEILGYSPKELFNHLEQYLGHPCIVCKEIDIKISNSHIDHIIPISLAKDRDAVVKLNQMDNLRLICARCNMKKSNKLEKIHECN